MVFVWNVLPINMFRTISALIVPLLAIVVWKPTTSVLPVWILITSRVEPTFVINAKLRARIAQAQPNVYHVKIVITSFQLITAANHATTFARNALQ